MFANRNAGEKSFLKTAICSFMVVVMSIGLSGCYFLPKEEEVLAPPIKEPEKVEYETVKAQKGTIINEIKCNGGFVSVSQTDLFYKDRGGRIKKIYVKYGDKVKKGQLVAELETDDIQTDLELQRLALEKAKISYDKIKSQNSIEGGGKYDLELAELEVETCQVRLNSLLDQLAQAKLVSPIDGQVVYVTDAKQGEVIYAYNTIARVANPKDLQLQYSDDMVSSFSLGNDVEVTIDSKVYKGKVIATPSDMPKDASEKVKKSVRIKVYNLPASVELGTTAYIRLVLEKHDNVIVLQRSCINTFNGRKFVNVLKDGVREERDVQTGLQTSTEVEVTKGISAGELIITK